MKIEEGHLQQSLLDENQTRQQSQEEESPSKKDRKKDSYLENLPQINGSNILSTLFFGWLYPFLAYGSRKTVTVDSMPKLPQKQKSLKEFEIIKQKLQNTKKSQREGLTLIKVLVKTYYCEFLILLTFLTIYVTIQSVSPYITALMMRYISHKQDYQSYYGPVLFVIILVLQIVKAVCATHMGYQFSKFGIQLTNNLTLLIYNKSLKYQSIAEKQFTESDIINYSQVDAERMSQSGYDLSAVILAPPQIVVGMIMMYDFIGISFVAGIVVMIITILSTYVTAKRSYRFNKQILRCKDERMKITQQILDIIRYIKINSIQKFFYNRVDEKRKEEVKFYKKQGLMWALNIFIFWSACPLILSATFVTYVLLGNEMNSQVAFTTIMIFTTLQYPIRLLPNSISSLIQMFTSIKRIQKYLYSEQIKTQHMRQVKDDTLENAICIERGNFYYGVEKENKQTNQKNIVQKNYRKIEKNQLNEQENKDIKQIQESSEYIPENQDYLEDNKNKKDEKYVRVLKDINTTIKKGNFTMVIGDIGSGKSSLLMAILNQMVTDDDSSVLINGSIAYSSQKPWIMSTTVKQNILFQSPFNHDKFEQVIHFASLEQDIKLLPFGVETQIGEKGINLSGGQKARIGLARALYSDRDIILLDDILSAVDVHVGQFLMKETLMKFLKGKTVIMPTHALKYAEMVDQIIIMDKGCIVRKGHFRDISNTSEFQQVFLLEQKTKKNGSEKTSQKIEENNEIVKNETKRLLQHKDKEIEISESDKIVKELILPEDQQVGQVNYKIFKQYIILNGGYFNFAFLILLAMTFWVVTTTASSIIMEKWCEDPLGQGYDLYLYVGLSVGAGLFIFYRAYNLIMAGARQGYIVHTKMIKALLYASLGNFFNRVPVGRIVNRLTKDLRELDEVIGFKIGNLLLDFFRLIGDISICIYASTPLVLIPLLFISYLSHRVRKYYMKSQIEVARYQKSTNSPIVSGFISSINGLPSIRAYKMGGQFLQKQLKLIDINKRVRLTKNGMESWFSINLTYLSFFVNMASIGYCMLSENTNASLAGLLMNYAINLCSDIIQFTDSVTLFQSAIVSLERIYSFMNIQPEKPYLQYCSHWVPEQEGFHDVIQRGQIQFKGTYVRYRRDLPDVLKEMNIVIKPGQKIGIVGRTGAGKTTIINTLLRITQISNGDLFIDGTRIQDYAIKHLRNGITMIDQEPTLIKSTFRQNLDITHKYTDQQLHQILKECNLYDTIIEKGGLQATVSNQSLSAGQKQLLCICRAFLKHSKIVLVDEATANIDNKNDAAIQQVISDKFHSCTVLTIAHRLSTLSNSDKILVMEKGQIVEFGSPEELRSKQKSWYREMVEKNDKDFLI